MRQGRTFAFPKSRRMVKRADFAAFGNGGRRYFSRSFIVVARPRASGPAASPAAAFAAACVDSGWRIGLAITKKVGPAVARNRIKRLAREFFRRHPELLPPGVDLLVIAAKGMDPQAITQQRADAELAEIMRRLRKDLKLCVTTQSGLAKPGGDG